MIGRRLAFAGLVFVTVGDWVIVGAGWLSASYLAGLILWSWSWNELAAEDDVDVD